ncbi:MAG: hypothetical protein ACRD00_00745 [Thermoanaerobaculia bacterium]
MLAFLLAAAALAADAPQAPGALRADFDGDGRMETATARLRGKAVRLAILDRGGKRLASTDAPAPEAADVIRLESGALGSPGALMEVVASGGSVECHSIWRFRGGALTRLPVRSGPQTLPDCARPDGWTTAWERKAADAPAVWVRQRSRETAGGAHRQREVYVFSGFALDLDPARSSAEIADVPIPQWNDAVLYPKWALEILSSRYDLARFRAGPRLRLRADRTDGRFVLAFEDHAGKLEAPVTAVGPGGESKEVELTISTENGPAKARVTVRGSIVWEARVTGVSARWDSLYQPVSRFAGGALEVYARAEDEVASNCLVGLWSSERGEQLALNLVPGVLGVLDMRRTQVEVQLDPVPAGADILLLPGDGSAPSWALALKGFNGIARIPVQCAGRTGAWSCEPAGPAEAFHRVGGRVNAR